MFISKANLRQINDRDNLLHHDCADITEMLSRSGTFDFVPATPQIPAGANRATVSRGTNSGKPSPRDAIAAIARDFIVEVADTPELILEAKRLRYQVYCVERGYEKSDNGIEEDEFDSRARHLVLRRRSDGEVVGTTRVVPYNPALPHDSYPMQHACDTSLLHNLPTATTAEISRFAISKRLRGVSPALMRLALMAGVLKISHELGLTDWCATMEPCLLRLLQSSAVHFRPLGPLVEYHGLRQPCCAKITEVLARMQADRPEVWAFVTDNGRYYSEKPAPATTFKPIKRIPRDWQTTITEAARFAFSPTFQTA
jgi:N-acyl-L-homoserine lactone synthetase